MGKFLTSKDIGFRLRLMRQKAGLTQEELAEMIGVSAQAVQKIESGKSKLNTDRLQQLSEKLSIPIQSFFSGQEEHMPLVESEKLLIDSYRSIENRDIRESILKIVINAARER